MTEGRIIYNPSASVMKLFYRKMNAESREELKSRKFDAVGLLQTTVAGVLYYADRAFKTSNVYPVEIKRKLSTAYHYISFLWRDNSGGDSDEDFNQRREREEESFDVVFII